MKLLYHVAFVHHCKQMKEYCMCSLMTTPPDPFFRLNDDDNSAPHVTSLLDQARDHVMNSPEAAVIPLFPCLSDLDNLLWSRTNCKRIRQYIKDRNYIVLEVQRGGNVKSEGTQFVLFDLEKTTVSCSRDFSPSFLFLKLLLSIVLFQLQRKN